MANHIRCDILKHKNNYLMIKERKWSDLGVNARDVIKPAETADARPQNQKTRSQMFHTPHQEFYNRKSKYLLYVVEMKRCAVEEPLHGSQP